LFVCVCACVCVYIVGLLEQVSLPTFLKTKVTMQYQCVTVCKQRKGILLLQTKRKIFLKSVTTKGRYTLWSKYEYY